MNNSRTTQGGDRAMDSVDWRAQLQAGFREHIVSKIMEKLKTDLPFAGQEGLQELKKIVVRIEEKIYTTATSRPDYIRNIVSKMSTLERNYQNTMPNSLQSNPAGDVENPPEPDSRA